MWKNTFLLIILFGVFCSCKPETAVYYVSPLGDDNNSGSIEAPFQTLHRTHAEMSKYAGEKPITVYLREGTYYLNEPLLFTSDNSGTKENPIRYISYNDERARISGAEILSQLDWSEYKGNIMQASINQPLIFDQLFVNGIKQIQARYPNYDKDIAIFNGFASDALDPNRVAHWNNPAGGFAHVMHSHEWGGYHYEIVAKNDRNELELSGGYQNNRQMGMHTQYRMVENIFEELDAPGEWYYDKDESILYFYPPTGTDLSNSVIELPQIEILISIKGNENNPVKYVEFDGIEFTHTLRTFMKTEEQLLRSDWAIYRGAAILMEGAENCLISNCDIYDLGGNAIFFSNYNRNNRIEGNHIANIGASAVCFVGDPEAVRSPAFEYGEFVEWSQIDTVPGPKTNNYPADCFVNDNLIHNIGTVEKQVSGVQISMSQNITVGHNTIYNLPRSGININEGTWGGHIIEWNDVFNTVLETGDHGSFNSWGRDRFWHPDRKTMDSIMNINPECVLWDAVKTTHIRNNRWRCDHGWDIDLDDGSSNYYIYNNLCLNGGIKLREGYLRVVENNIMVNNSFHPHVWFEKSEDVFRNNIVTKPYYPIGINTWGKEVESNLLPDSASLLNSQMNGTDKHSLAGDPLFIDANAGNYNVRDESPALKIGFKNFPTDQFGVKSERLKKVAEKVNLPIYEPSVEASVSDEIYSWRGLKLKDLTTEGERSATGMDGIRGVFILGIEDDSPLKKQGLELNDVILKYNNNDINNLTDFQKLTSTLEGKKVQLTIFRNQKTMTLDFLL